MINIVINLIIVQLDVDLVYLFKNGEEIAVNPLIISLLFPWLEKKVKTFLVFKDL